MKYKFFKCFLLSIIISCPQYIIAQEALEQAAVANSLIIYAKGDTLKSKVIISSNKKTNEDQLTYILNDKEIVVTSAELVSFFNGTSTFYSKNIVDQTEKKLIKNVVSGPLYLGQSFKKNGTSVYYIKKENDDKYISLDKYEFNVESFLQNYLSDFADFKSNYRKKIYYDYKSLGEFASAYNAFKIPETYVPQKFENTEKIKFGVFGSVNLSGISFKDNSIKFDYALSYSFGLSVVNQYSRMFSLDVLASYNYSKNKAKDQNIDAIIKTVGIEPSLGTSFFIKDYLCLKVDLGLVIYYNMNSGIDLYDNGSSVLVKGFNFGYSGGLEANYKSKYYTFIKYINYNVKTNNFDPGGIESSSKKGKYSNFRFGIGYNF